MKKLILISSLFVTASLLAATYNTETETIKSTTTTTPNGNRMLIDKTQSTELKDRFTTTEDHKLGSQIRVQIAEVIGAPKANEVFLIIDSGDVKIIGKVPSEEVKAKLIQAIHQIKGVKSIHNKLEVEKK